MLCIFLCRTQVNQIFTYIELRLIKPCCPENYLLPNVITATTKDGINDYFCLTPDIDFSEMEITIYNRWGRSVFHSKDPEFKWEGMVRGTIVTGEFFYVLELNKQFHFQGVITVF